MLTSKSVNNKDYDIIELRMNYDIIGDENKDKILDDCYFYVKLSDIHNDIIDKTLLNNI